MALFAALLAPAGARAGGKVPAGGLSKADVLRAATLVARRTEAVIAVADLLDELTRTKGELALKSAGRKPVVEKTYFGVEFRVPEVEFEDCFTNAVFGAEVPGRRVSVTIRVDCQVDCRVDAANIRVARHEDYEDTVVITVPTIEVIGRVPEGREYRYEVDYGRLRSKWLSGEEAREFRKGMVAGAARKAADEFRRGPMMKEFRKGFKRELRRYLKPAFPADRRIEIRFEEDE
jgi:hypothetical protein